MNNFNWHVGVSFSSTVRYAKRIVAKHPKSILGGLVGVRVFHMEMLLLSHFLII